MHISMVAIVELSIQPLEFCHPVQSSSGFGLNALECGFFQQSVVYFNGEIVSFGAKLNVSVHYPVVR